MLEEGACGGGGGGGSGWAVAKDESTDEDEDDRNRTRMAMVGTRHDRWRRRGMKVEEEVEEKKENGDVIDGRMWMP